MNRLNLNKAFFLLILLLAFILRFYKLGEVPLSLDWDENSNAYNAYSILKTGRDEYGQLFPITNKSFDDYKPPAYMYLNVISVGIFGLTPFAARLPSALFGFLTVPVVYFLAKLLFEDQKKEKRETIALVSSLLLAIAPWHIQFSRVGFEATVGLFFATASITIFLYGLNHKKLLPLAGILLGLSAYTYHTQRIFVPLIFISAIIIWHKKVFSLSKKYLLAFVIITTLIGLPLVILIPPKVILQRFEVTTGRPKLEDIEKSISLILQDQEDGSSFGKIIHNRRFVIGQTYFSNYLSHFDPNFLFTIGDDNFRHHIQNMGMLYLFELPLVLIGIYTLIKNKNKSTIFLLVWLIIAPIAATPATPNPHANRSLPLIIALEITVALAFASIYYASKFPIKKIVISIVPLFAILSLFTYLHNYYVHYPNLKAEFWQFGYKEAAIESEILKDKYQKINVSGSIEQAYIFWLFNSKYDPAAYQKEGSRYHFDKFYFDAEKPTDQNELFITDAKLFPGGFKIIKTIYYPNGEAAIIIGHPQ